jgi:hypothetical protein
MHVASPQRGRAQSAAVLTCPISLAQDNSFHPLAFAGSLLLAHFAAERQEVLRHKWLESEKANCDIGFENALMDWIVRHRSAWLRCR